MFWLYLYAAIATLLALFMALRPSRTEYVQVRTVDAESSTRITQLNALRIDNERELQFKDELIEESDRTIKQLKSELATERQFRREIERLVERSKAVKV